jgi:hypothetical protein
MEENDEIDISGLKLVLITGDEVYGRHADSDF